MKTQNIVIAHPENEAQIDALKAFMKALKIKFEVSGKRPYSPDFVSDIEQSKEQYRKGDFISVEKNELKDFLGLK